MEIHDTLTKVALGDEGQPGIARAVHELTNLSTAIEDRMATCRRGPGRAAPIPIPEPTQASGAGSWTGRWPPGPRSETVSASSRWRWLSGGRCRIGVGGPCLELSEFSRPPQKAEPALRIQKTAGGPEQVTLFDHLGVYKVPAAAGDTSAMERFVAEWLGQLIDYDARRGTSPC